MVTRETTIKDGLSSLGFADELSISRLLELSKLLVEVAIPRGVVGRNEGARIATRHVLESAAMCRLLPADGLLVDVGSGAGLPGLVLASLRDGPVVLVEAQAKRSSFLRRAIATLELDSTEVRQDRAEVIGRAGLRESAQVVTARALASVPVALELTLPLVGPKGISALATGALDRGSLDGFAEVCALLGGDRPEAVEFEVPGLNEGRWVMIVGKVGPTPDRFPRTASAMSRRPLGGVVE